MINALNTGKFLYSDEWKRNKKSAIQYKERESWETAVKMNVNKHVVGKKVIGSGESLVRK